MRCALLLTQQDLPCALESSLASSVSPEASVPSCLVLPVVATFGAKLGEAVDPYPSARIWVPWNLEMGDHSCLSEEVDCCCVNKTRIGTHATVSQYSFLCAASHDYKGRL